MFEPACACCIRHSSSGIFLSTTHITLITNLPASINLRVSGPKIVCFHSVFIVSFAAAAADAAAPPATAAAAAAAAAAAGVGVVVVVVVVVVVASCASFSCFSSLLFRCSSFCPRCHDSCQSCCYCCGARMCLKCCCTHDHGVLVLIKPVHEAICQVTKSEVWTCFC